MRDCLVFFIATALCLGGQAGTPVPTQRTPPPGDPLQAAAANAVLSGQTAPQITGTITKAPASFRPDKELPLSKELRGVMHEAGRLAVPSVEADGLVRYRYGEGLATVVCAPFHLCSIELEDGEALTSQPATDKSWEAEPFAGVIDGRLHSTVNVHPKTSNIESTLFFYTDRRTYTLRLLPRQHEYMPRIAFSYADQHMNLWAQYRAKVAELKLFTPPPDPPAPPKIETWTLGYRIHGKKVGWPKKHEQHPPFWPRSVKDNGSRIFIQLPDAIAHTRSPLFMRVGPKGLEQVDFHPDGLCYTVDVLIDHLALVSDQGKHQQVVYIDSPRLP